MDTNTTATVTTLEEDLEPALEAYATARDEHGHDSDAAGWKCRCGWRPTREQRTPRRAVGIHISAAHKRAERTYDEAADKIIAERSARSARRAAAARNAARA